MLKFLLFNNIRQLSVIIIKNKIQNSTENLLNLDDIYKTQIKNNILASLISQDIEVKKVTTLCILGICCIELPKNLWINIFIY